MPEPDKKETARARGPLGRFLAMSNDSTVKTVIVTVGLCLVCSIIVSVSAVVLKPQQLQNKALDKQQNILEVAGLLEPGQAPPDGAAMDDMARHIEARIVDLASGRFMDNVDAAAYDQRRAARDPARSMEVAAAEDIAGIGRRAQLATVYFVRRDGDVSRMILPIHGYGLWSTLYGFVSLEPDGNTVYRLKFYEHRETPGLGGEVDNPQWRAAWRGKKLFGDDGAVNLKLIKGFVNRLAPDAAHQVDGLSGATITSRGVTNLFRYWFGEQGFGPFLRNWQGGMRSAG